MSFSGLIERRRGISFSIQSRGVSNIESGKQIEIQSDTRTATSNSGFWPNGPLASSTAWGPFPSLVSIIEGRAGAFSASSSSCRLNPRRGKWAMLAIALCRTHGSERLGHYWKRFRTFWALIAYIALYPLAPSIHFSIQDRAPRRDAKGLSFRLHSATLRYEHLFNSIQP